MSQAEQSIGEGGLLHSPCPYASKGKFVSKADESEEVLADAKSAGYNVTRVKFKGDHESIGNVSETNLRR